MFKFAVVILAVIVCAAAKPGLIGAPLAYNVPTAAVVAAPAPIVTATSSQVVARNYNGIATAPVVAPVAAPVIAKAVAPLSYAAPFATPVIAKYTAAYPAPLTYSAPVVAKYATAYSHPLAYSTHLTYAAALAPVVF